MNCRERFLTAMDHKQPDRIPLFDFLFQEDLFQEVLGHRPGAYNAEDAVKCSLKMGEDGVWIPCDGFSGYSPKELGGGTYEDEWGTVYKKTDSSWPIDPPIAYPVETWEDFRNVKVPDPHDPNRVSSVKEALKLAEGKIAVLGGVNGPFTALCSLMGMENACFSSIEEPELFHAIMRMATDYNIAIGLHILEAGADAIIISEDMGYNSGTFLSPDNMRIFILSYIKEMTAAFKKKGARIMLHCDGNMNGILDDLAHCGIDAWQPLERKGKNDLKYVKETYGNILTPVGNVDSSITLPFGSREDVINQTLECMRVAGPGGGYILGSDHSLHDGIPVENILAMVETVQKYGAYPLNLPDRAE